MRGDLLDANQASEYLGITSTELMMSRYRGLSPGILGFKTDPYGPVLWKEEDLLPVPRKNRCPVCGFQARSAAGLKTHARKHKE